MVGTDELAQYKDKCSQFRITANPTKTTYTDHAAGVTGRTGGESEQVCYRDAPHLRPFKESFKTMNIFLGVSVDR